MKIEQALSFDDVLIVPQYSNISSRSDCDLQTNLGTIDLEIPIIAANMDTICGPEMMAGMGSLGGAGILHRYMKVSELFHFLDDFRIADSPYDYIVAVGTLENDARRIDTVLADIVEHNDGHLHICVDIAHGHSKNMKATIRHINKFRKDNRLTFTLIAGNVCTAEAAKDLFQCGADVVKVGIGPGSACTTRIKTGCGYPQLTAIEQCAQVGPVIADGGIRTAGDAAKALAVGAKAVMIGGMLAGTDYVPGWQELSPNWTGGIPFRGMASKEARKACGGTDNNAEGIETLVAPQPVGSTQSVVEGLCEGIRSAMSYSGALTLEDFINYAKLVQCTPNIINENRPHIL